MMNGFVTHYTEIGLGIVSESHYRNIQLVSKAIDVLFQI